MRLGVIRSMVLTREPPRLVLTFTGGIPDQVMNFDSEAAVLGAYDEIVAIEEADQEVLAPVEPQDGGGDSQVREFIEHVHRQIRGAF